MNGFMFLAQTGAATQPAQSLWEDVGESVQRTLKNTSYWQWGVLLLGIFLGLLLGRLARMYLCKFGEKWKASHWPITGSILLAAAAPASLFLFTSGTSVGLGGIAMGPAMRTFILRCVTLLYTVAIGWFLYNLAEVGEVALKRMLGRRRSSYMEMQLAPLMRKTLRVFLVIVLTLYVAENVFNRDVSSWLAGLGIAGLAVSLSAQDSIRNLFGSITILLDRPFQAGDWIGFDKWEGVVEEIGFRSTKIITAEGVIVTIPNANISVAPVLNFSRRDFIRRVLDISINYSDNNTSDVQNVVKKVQEVFTDESITKDFDLQKHPPRISVTEIRPNVITLKVFYWVRGMNPWSFLETAKIVNMKLEEAFKDLKINLTYPMQMMSLVNDQASQVRLSVGKD